MAAARQRQRIDDAIGCERRVAKRRKLGIDEAQIEFRIMRDQHGIGDEAEELLSDLGEFRFARQKFERKAVDAKRLLRHVALGIEVEMKRLPGRNGV